MVYNININTGVMLFLSSSKQLNIKRVSYRTGILEYFSDRNFSTRSLVFPAAERLRSETLQQAKTNSP